MKIWNTCIAGCLLALASFSSRVPAGAVGPGGGTLERALEQELALARRPDLYLLIDSAAGTVEVKARGLVLASIAAERAIVLSYRRFGSDPTEPAEILPTVRTVVDSELDERRPMVTAGPLRPYPDGGEDDRADPAYKRAPAPQPAPEESRPPARYRADLDEGWELWVGQGRPGPGWLARWVQALVDGWSRWRGVDPEPRIVVGLALQPEDARRLHHLVRPGARLLVF